MLFMAPCLRLAGSIDCSSVMSTRRPPPFSYDKTAVAKSIYNPRRRRCMMLAQSGKGNIRNRGVPLRRVAAWMLIASLAGACTKSNTIVMTAEQWETSQMRQQLADQGRVESVGLPLLASAASQCGSELGRTLGATF